MLGPPDSVILWLWLPVFLFAHVFAGYWIARAMFLMNPQLCAGWFKWPRQGRLKAAASVAAASGRGIQPSQKLAGALDLHVLSEVADEGVAAHLEAVHGTGDEGAMHPGQPIAQGRGAARLSSGGGASQNGSTGTQRSSGGGRLQLVHVQHTDLDWRGLSCSYRTNTGTKWVLQDVYGAAMPGEMQALLGPSGAGKSTLMDMLAQRKSTGRLEGTLLVNGRRAGPDFIRRTTYVPQYDNFVPVMTAAEVLEFYAGIILPRDWGAARRAARVEEVLQAMGLSHAAGTLVGGQSPGGLLLRGLSGGERKRLSIAVGILAAPSVVFLDEPTTGLDSFAALTVMGYLKRMARDIGHVVIAAIHQPRSAIWSMFDAATLLSCGRLMYHGPRDGLVPWFHGLGFEYDAALHGVVSDWALDLVACGSHKPASFFGPRAITTRDQVKAASSAFVAHWVAARGLGAPGMGGGGGGGGGGAHGAAGRLVGAIRGAAAAAAGARSNGADKGAVQGAATHGGAPAPSPLPPACPPLPGGAGCCFGGAPGDERPLRPSTWLQQYCWTLRREVIVMTRNPADVAGRTLTFAWVAASTGIFYYGLPNDGAGAKLRVNMLLNIIAFFCLIPYISMSMYTADKKTYLADVSAKLFRPSAYYMAKVTATIPFHLVSSLVFTFIIYGMAGLRPDPPSVLQNGALSALMSLISVQVMHCCAVFAPTQDMAFMYSISWTAIQLLFNNFSITFNEITLPWLEGVKYLSAAYYAFEGLSVIEFKGVKVSCSAGMDPSGLSFLRELLPNSKILQSRAVLAAAASPGADCIADLEPVLEYYGFKRGFAASFGVLLAYWVATHCLTYAAMRVVARKERR